MVNRMTIALEQPEYAALLDVALSELRNPADQLRYMLRQELERRGLLPQEAARETMRITPAIGPEAKEVITC